MELRLLSYNITFILITSFYKKNNTYSHNLSNSYCREQKNVPTSMETAAKDAMIIVGPIYQGILRPQQNCLVIRHMTLDTQLRWIRSNVGFVLI